MSVKAVTNSAMILMLYLGTALIVVLLFQEPTPLYLPSLIYLAITFSAVITLGKYVTYVLLGSYFSLHQRKKVSSIRYNPPVSVVIPAWNEEIGIINTISSVLTSEYKNIEIIVINDGSTDNSDKKIRDYLITHNLREKSKSFIPIIYKYIANSGKSTALNTAIEISRGEIIITIDADCQVRSNTITEFVKMFADPTVAAAVGTVKIGNIETLWGLLQRLEYIVGFYFKRADAVMNSIYIIGGAAGAFRKSIFKSLGPYRTDHITEDTELTLRIQKAGLKIAYAVKAIVYTEGASTLSGLLRQRLRWKRGRFDAFIEHRDLFFNRTHTHRKILGWLVLPFVLIGDAHTLLELPFLIALTTYGVLSHDFLPLFSSIAILGILTSLQIIVSENGWKRVWLVLLTPISWWLLLIITIIELYSLIHALWSMKFGTAIRWQRWQRVGLSSQNLK